MTEKKVLKPATTDLKVRDPQTGNHLPAEGAEVELNSYWRRRLRDGDVQEAQVPRAQGSAGAADVVEAKKPRAGKTEEK